MTFTITPLYVLPLALIYLILWFRVSSLRSALGVSIGDGGNMQLLQRIRQHSNCAEWSSFVLILMILAEGSGASPGYIHAAGALLVLGRSAHPFGLLPETAGHPLRYVGNGANLLACFCALAGIAVAIFGR